MFTRLKSRDRDLISSRPRQDRYVRFKFFLTRKLRRPVNLRQLKTRVTIEWAAVLCCTTASRISVMFEICIVLHYWTQCFFVTVRAGTAYRKIWRLVNNFFCSHNKVDSTWLFWSCLIQQSMLTLGYSEHGDQPLTETVKNEIETLRPMTAWLQFGTCYKMM